MFKTVIIAAFAALAPAGAAVAADELDAASIKTLHDYQITTPKVEAYDKAYGDLTQAASVQASLRKELEAMGAERTSSVAAEVDKMARHPIVYAFFEKAGLSKEDAVELPMALIGGCVVAEHPEDAGKIPQASNDQVTYCKANYVKIKQLKLFAGGKPG